MGAFSEGGQSEDASLTSHALHPHEFLTHLEDAVFRQEPAKIGQGIDQGITTNDGARINHCVTADLGTVTNDRAKFAKTSRDEIGLPPDTDLLSIQQNIGKNNPCAEMDLIP